MRRDEVRKLMRRSEGLWAAAEFHMSRGEYDLAIFNLEQSLQLFLKAVLLEAGVDFPRTHGLRRLFMLLGEVAGKRDLFREFVSAHSLEFASLEDAYITARYFPRDFGREEAERLMEFVRGVKDFVRRFYPA